MSKTIQDLREHLFAAIQGVRDGSVSIEQAKTISDLSQVIVNTAKVEVDFVRATERRDSLFLLGSTAQGGPTINTTTRQATSGALPNGINSITRHVLADD